ncbi:GNAT family N-acetyltransferase [Lactococcus fujiensis]|uniref:N-acetyltransferase domain-containing protein n=1 Tax=Lactococcus fujiensis JCM 16395 TaxID=1291764 RepID=A0A2A5RL20_9LACT|nr:GNAT family N-acetyltransferase [Lactococcus fujiensis]PCR99875.1 hypothetical protein RT41_GL001681 [Lactococcus fujiensis JCM 16395]
MEILIEDNEYFSKLIDQRLFDFNSQSGKTPYFTKRDNPDEGRKIGFYCTVDGKLIGGANTYLTHDWLYLDELFIEATYRRTGLGTQIMETIEAYARQHQLVGIYVETHEFQARGFYEKNDFVCLGELPNFPRGNKMYILTKVFEKVE